MRPRATRGPPASPLSGRMRARLRPKARVDHLALQIVPVCARLQTLTHDPRCAPCKATLLRSREFRALASARHPRPNPAPSALCCRPGSPGYGRGVQHGLPARAVPRGAGALVDRDGQGSCSAARVSVQTQAARARLCVCLRCCDLPMHLYGAVGRVCGAGWGRAAGPGAPGRPVHRARPNPTAPNRPGASGGATCAPTPSARAARATLCRFAPFAVQCTPCEAGTALRPARARAAGS